MKVCEGGFREGFRWRVEDLFHFSIHCGLGRDFSMSSLFLLSLRQFIIPVALFWAEDLSVLLFDVRLNDLINDDLYLSCLDYTIAYDRYLWYIGPHIITICNIGITSFQMRPPMTFLAS